MKKILSVILLVCFAFVLSSCGEYDTYNELGLNYELPADFEEFDDNPYGMQRYYSKGKAGFGFNVYSSNGLENQGVDPDITASEYMNKFLIWNALEYEKNLFYEYDEETGIAEISYLVEYDEGTDSEVYRWIIMRPGEHLYVICTFYTEPTEEQNAPVIDRIINSIVVD